MSAFSKKIRSLHRDLGYFVIGLTLIYAITGIVLSGRGLGWFKVEFKDLAVIEKNISKDSFNDEFKKIVLQGKVKEIFDESSYANVKKHLKLKFVKQENEVLHFNAWRTLNVKYEQTSGNLDVRYKGYPVALEVFVHAHKAKHDSAWFYLAIIYSVILSFLAISSFWMVKGKNGFKRRGVYFMLAGFAVVALFLYI
ncbi:hypothetical protein ACH5BF_08910 [Arcobacter sp. YIC-464]|uniref:hypothetical protein n=1 Tax=Arcobacter sp. YIC-464 TaxID=3376631 RepID=UPI003C270589